MLFSKKHPKDEQECRYCKNSSSRDGICVCRYKGAVSPSGYCRRYRFDPFAPRVYRRRNLDVSEFDPLDFEI